MRAMSPRQAERFVASTMRALALTFAVVGVLFVAWPDGTLHRLDQVGNWLGGFAHAPKSHEKLWVALAFAYMVVITGIALVISTDVPRFRPMLLVLAAGKAASSLSSGVFYLTDEHAFAYLANFVVDLSLVGVALGCWVLSGRVVEAFAPD
jgi:drug/metabolite transporter (DMT)-like permease